jgi:hypothetical protein
LKIYNHITKFDCPSVMLNSVFIGISKQIRNICSYINCSKPGRDRPESTDVLFAEDCIGPPHNINVFERILKAIFADGTSTGSLA